ncbi:MAG: hypothetical protein E6Z44_09580 [Escherichia coli]|nr:hypothetical protein [Escherichia coli]
MEVLVVLLLLSFPTY